jgi:hypothetical protein
MALQPFVGPWRLLQFLNLFYTDDRTPWTSDQPVYLHTRQFKHRINAHTDIHALSGIRTQDPSVRDSEDSSCFRPRGHCDRLFMSCKLYYLYKTYSANYACAVKDVVQAHDKDLIDLCAILDSVLHDANMLQA